MAPKCDLSIHHSNMTQAKLEELVRKYDIPRDLHPSLPEPDQPIYPFHRPGTINLYSQLFSYSNVRVPFSRFLIKVLTFYGVHIAQCNPLGLGRVSHFEISCRAHGKSPSLSVFRKFYKLNHQGDWFTFECRRFEDQCYTTITSSLKKWKPFFFTLDDRCVPENMAWRNVDSKFDNSLPSDFAFDANLFELLKANKTEVRPLPEMILIISRISRKWPHPTWWPVLRMKGKKKGECGSSNGYMCYLLCMTYVYFVICRYVSS
jgi:hypothetical protein